SFRVSMVLSSCVPPDAGVLSLVARATLLGAPMPSFALRPLACLPELFHTFSVVDDADEWIEEVNAHLLSLFGVPIVGSNKLLVLQLGHLQGHLHVAALQFSALVLAVEDAGDDA